MGTLPLTYSGKQHINKILKIFHQATVSATSNNICIRAFRVKSVYLKVKLRHTNVYTCRLILVVIISLKKSQLKMKHVRRNKQKNYNDKKSSFVLLTSLHLNIKNCMGILAVKSSSLS